MQFEEAVERQIKNTLEQYKNIDNLESVPADVLRAMYKDAIQCLIDKEEQENNELQIEHNNNCRTILFRGKRKDNNQWVVGSLIVSGDDCYITKGHCEIGTFDLNFIKYEVYPESVGQYTGVKDLSGRWIFEGDIVEVEESIANIFKIKPRITMVKYCFGTFICTDSNNRTDAL